MNAQVATAALTIVALATYQSFIKAIPQGVSPAFALVTFYVTALCCSLIALKFAPIDIPKFSQSQISWAAVGAGVAIVGIELGYLLMYRAGWHLAAAPLFVVGGAAILLTPVAIMVFRQSMDIRFVAGMMLCLCGLYLMAPKQA